MLFEHKLEGFWFSCSLGVCQSMDGSHNGSRSDGMSLGQVEGCKEWSLSLPERSTGIEGGEVGPVDTV